MPNLFPYTNTHELNLDWILQVVKDFQTKYTNFDQALADALAAIQAGKTDALDEISTDLTAALNDIEASQTSALTAIGNTKDSALADIGTALTNATNAISALNTTVQGEITTLKNTSISEITTAQGTAISAITASMNHATTIIEQLYNTLPSSAQDIISRLDLLDNIITGNTMESFTWLQGSYVYPVGSTPPTPPAIWTDSPTYNQSVSSRYMTGVGGRRIRIITDGTIYMTSILKWTNTPPGGGAGAYVPGQASWFTNTYADILLPLDVTAFSIELAKPNPADTIAPTDIPSHIEIQWITDFVSQRIIAPKESSTTADVARAAGEYFFLDGELYIATDNIDIGDTIAEGTNCEKKTVGGELSELKSALSDLVIQPTILNDTGITVQGYVRPNTGTSVALYRLNKGEKYLISTDSASPLMLFSNTLYEGTQFTAEFKQDPSSGNLAYTNELYDYLYMSKTSSNSTEYNPIVKVDVVGDFEKAKKSFEDVAYIEFEELTTTIQHGKSINYVGGINDLSGYVITDYIDIEGYASVKVSGRSNYSNGIACFYDSTKTFVSCPVQAASGSSNTTVNDLEIAVPYNAKYIIVSGREGSSTAFTPKVTAKQAYKLKKWKGLKWLAFGDSLTDARNAKATKRYFDYVQDATSITVLNGGVSGSGYCVDGEAALGADTNWMDRILTYSDTDFDVITLFGSFNDLGSGLPTGTASDTTTATKAGCINITLDNLFSIKPLAIVGVVTPTPWETAYPGNTAADNYVNVLIEICRKRGIPVLDLFHESLLRPWDATFRSLAYSRDGGYGVHPDENGHKMIAPRFEAFLDSLLLH